MNKYIENDYKKSKVKAILRDKLLIADAKETSDGCIIKAGWLKKFQYIPIDEDRKDWVSFTFRDISGWAHTTWTDITEELKGNKVPIGIGYEIIYDINNDKFSIAIHINHRQIKTNNITIPEKLFLEEYPDEKIIDFMETKLDIIENNIELLNNEKVNNLLKSFSNIDICNKI